MSEDPLHFSGEDIHLYRMVLNNPVFYIDSFGLMNTTPGGSLVEGDAGIGMMIDSYLRNNNGDHFQAWLELVGHRANGQYKGCDIAASAEHYLYSRSETQESIANALQLGVQVPGYQIYKTVTPDVDGRTPPSMNQLKWGYKGVTDELLK